MTLKKAKRRIKRIPTQAAIVRKKGKKQSFKIIAGFQQVVKYLEVAPMRVIIVK